MNTLGPAIFLTAFAALGFAMLAYLESGNPEGRSRQCFRTSLAFTAATIVLTLIHASTV
jgi:hypothetical protein